MNNYEQLYFYSRLLLSIADAGAFFCVNIVKHYATSYSCVSSFGIAAAGASVRVNITNISENSDLGEEPEQILNFICLLFGCLSGRPQDLSQPFKLTIVDCIFGVT